MDEKQVLALFEQCDHWYNEFESDITKFGAGTVVTKQCLRFRGDALVNGCRHQDCPNKKESCHDQ